MSEFRKDPVSMQWVIIAPERGRQPLYNELQIHKKEAEHDPNCPFCHGNESFTSRDIFAFHNKKQEWIVRVFANKFPSLKVETEVQMHPEGLHEFYSGVGAHEIIINTPFHNKTFADLDLENFEAVLKAMQARIRDLYNDRRLKYISVMHSCGKLKNSTIEHSYSQLIALPLIPDQIQSVFKNAKDYFIDTERCVYCDLIYQNLKNNELIVLENENFICLSPYAAKTPFELSIFPKAHQHDFSTIPNNQIKSLAILFQETLIRISKALNKPSFSFALRSSPNLQSFSASNRLNHFEHFFHWHIEIKPHLSFNCSSELLSGIPVNTVAPETAAEFLREVNIKSILNSQ